MDFFYIHFTCNKIFLKVHVLAIFINNEINITMHSYLKQRFKLYPKRHAKHYIVYKIYFKDSQK